MGGTPRDAPVRVPFQHRRGGASSRLRGECGGTRLRDVQEERVQRLPQLASSSTDSFQATQYQQDLHLRCKLGTQKLQFMEPTTKT